MNELTIEELDILVSAMEFLEIQMGFKDNEKELFGRMEEKLAERQELEAMDFNTCDGGACTL